MTYPLIAQIVLPDWWSEAVPAGLVLTSPEAQMDFALDLAARNINAKTGGPFGSAIFDTNSGQLIAAGVNLVVSSSMATAHAEMVAIAMAGVAIGNHDLATAGETQLVATTEPCAMCLGAVGWSGVTSAVFGARDEDARAVGFDEGTKPERWAEGLEAAGIEVMRDVHREEAAAVLRSYAESGGMIYNGRAALNKMGD